jgi:hypothetical protein
LHAASVPLRVSAGAGLLLFGVVLAAAALRPDIVESQAHEFVVQEVAQGAAELLAAADSVGVGRLVEQLPGRLSAQADSLRSFVDSGAPARVAEMLASACHYCGPADSLEPAIVGFAEDRIGLLQRAAGTARSWALNRYAETVTGLVRDLRVFSGVNATLFAMVLIASFVAPSVPRAPALTLWLLLSATIISLLFYVFAQNWFFTLLTGRFVGFGYAAWAAVVFVVLIDWVLNRARITQAFVNGIGALVPG